MVRIVSDGTFTDRVKVYDENGNEIERIASIEIKMMPNDVIRAKITQLVKTIDIIAQEEFIHEPLIMPDADKKYLKALGIIAMLALMLFIWKFNGSL